MIACKLNLNESLKSNLAPVYLRAIFPVKKFYATPSISVALIALKWINTRENRKCSHLSEFAKWTT